MQNYNKALYEYLVGFISEQRREKFENCDLGQLTDGFGLEELQAPPFIHRLLNC